MSLKGKTLEILRERQGGYVSGEELSKRLGISRAAVWKHVRTLRKQGYEINASPRRGYSLTAVPDLLLPAEIKRKLRTRSLGEKILYFSEVSSTNDELKKIADREPEGTLMLAEVQAGGRGRMARKWYSPFGGLWFSLLLRPKMAPSEAPKLTLMAAVAVTKSIREFTGLEALIKWPNDILVAGKKVAGILTEMAAETDRIDYLILGIGINLNINLLELPPSLRKEAGSLVTEYGSAISRADFLAFLLKVIEDEYDSLSEIGFGRLLEEWRKYDGTRGRYVKIETVEGKIEGVAQGIDDEGNLIIERGGERRRIRSGTVSMVTSSSS
jgi:BirA family biotin operon repressor/biotin-[acetyl-CoA-carboxylase] ligase